MARSCLPFFGVALVLAIGLSSAVAPVRADKAFRDEFISKYVKDGSSDSNDQTFKAAVEKANCNVCHAGKNKKQRNAYGDALAQLLSRKTDKENKEKIQASLDKVAGIKCDPKDPKAPTFGDLIKQGKLPGGEAKDTSAP